MRHLDVTQPITAIHTSTGQAVVSLSSPAEDDVEAAVKELESLMNSDGNYPNQRIAIEFSKPSKIRVNRGKRKLLDKMEAKFFTSGDNAFCYTFYHRTGYPLDYMEYQNICRLSINSRDLFEDRGAKRQIQRVKQILSLGRAIHPNAWDDLRAKITANPHEYLGYGLSRVDISKKFPAYVIEQLKKAFETKTDYSYAPPPGYRAQRRFSVSAKLCGDGIFRAWFSSEFRDCGNGTYYLLLNPTTASLAEND